jgi:molybdopterin molybdotransferase
LDRIRTLSTVDVDLEVAVGSVAATDVVAEEAVPPFANSAMDGYAVRSGDTSDAPVDLTVIGTLIAGQSTDQVVGVGEALRIMTGAPLPTGADAVILLERTQTAGSTVTVQIPVSPGTSIRRTGEDVRPGDLIVGAGTILTPSHLGMLASVGVNRVTTYRKPRVGVLSTGDELVTNVILRPGEIRNSNGPALRALVRELGFETVDLGVVTDDEDELIETIERAVASCDAVVTTGGVSVGDADNVRVVLERLGDARCVQVAVRPAKPLAFAIVRGVPVFGLPGNPASAMVSFELFVRPALLRMAGRSDSDRLVVLATAVEGLPRARNGKTHFLWVVARHDDQGLWSVRPADKGGRRQFALSANAYVLLADGEGAAPGSLIQTMLLTYR